MSGKWEQTLSWALRFCAVIYGEDAVALLDEERTMTALTGRQVVGAAAASRVGTAGIDQTLSDAVNSRRVPGVVGLATNDRGMIYSGAFGVRRLAQPQAMTVDSVFWIASMTKAATGGGHADGRAWPPASTDGWPSYRGPRYTSSRRAVRFGISQWLRRSD